MPGIYPLRPIITSDDALTSLYNADPTSVYYISECVTPAQAAQLLDEGVHFDTVVLVNGEGRELIDRLLPKEAYEPELFPRIEEMPLEAVDPRFLGKIHARLRFHMSWFNRIA